MARTPQIVLFFTAFAALAASCSDPQISEYEARTGIITGNIFYPGGTARGNVIVLLFREDQPPPPKGTSGPVNFIVVPEEVMFKDVAPDVVGDFAAPFTMPSVAPGRYNIRAFLDADGDFNPVQTLLAQPTAGDIGGGYVDSATRVFLPVVVEANKVSAQVTVFLASELPVERPAFAITSSTSFDVPFSTPKKLSIAAHPIQRAQVQMDPAKTAFLIQYIDENGDGVTDDINGDHLPDLYPKVILRRTTLSDNGGTILIPLIIDPFKYLDAIGERGFALTTALELIIPPVAVERTAAGDTILPETPPGEYETIVISGTGQTWQIPNALDVVQPGEVDPTQSVKVSMNAGAPLPAGMIRGKIRTSKAARGDAYVIAFNALNPPPPVGTGRPVALGSVPKASFVTTGNTIEAPFTIRGLADGAYILVGILDADNNFSPLVDLIAQPSSGDLGGRSTPPVVTVNGGPTDGVTVELDTEFLYDRPAFEMEAVSIPRTAFPAAIELRMRAGGTPPISTEPVKVPVVLTAADQENDNFPDLLPRVLLTKMLDGDPRTALDDPDTTVIPGIVDPLPFISALANGAPAVEATALRVILPPVAVKISPTGVRAQLAPPPAGRYRVNLLSATGQTWSVPSALDLTLGRAGTPREDPAQARYVEVTEAAVPMGAITGTIRLLAAPPETDYSVIVFAFDVLNPPPPYGGGRPVATAIIQKGAFNAGEATYALGGLPTGTYQIRAFLDADDDFTPWFDTMNQPDRNDLLGGYISLQGVPQNVAVDALQPPVSDILVNITSSTIAFDRPMFMIDPGRSTLDLSDNMPLVTTLTAVSSNNNVLRQDGTFPIQWADPDGNREADNINGVEGPDVFPLVLAELLDPTDPTNTRVVEPRVRIPGIVSPLQFLAIGFPGNDTTQTRVIVPAEQMIVAFPPIQGIPPGKYRIVVINERGQTWIIPNELTRASGTDLPATQGGYLLVRE